MKVSLLVLLIVPIFLFQCKGKDDQIPVAKDGVLDLRNWNFQSSGNASLIGEWEMYWEGDSRERILYYVPGHWNKLNRKNGYAHLKLRLLLPENAPTLSIQTGVTRSAYEFFADKNLLFRSGRTGLDKEAEIPSLDINTFHIPVKETREVEIMINVSCFHYHLCGIATPFVIGTETNINKSFMEAISRDWIVMSSLGALALFLLIIFVFWKYDRFHIFYSFVCLIAAFRVFCLGEVRLVYYFVPPGNYENILKLNGLTLVSLVCFFIMYVRSVYNEKQYAMIYRINLIVALSLLLALPFEMILYSQLLAIYLVLTFVTLLTLFYPIFMGVKRKILGSRIFLFSILSTMFLFLLDIMTEFGQKGGIYQVQYGFLIFGFSQAMFISYRLLENFKNKEVLKREKDKAEAKASFKTEFLSMMSHEIRTPMNGILGMSQLLKNTQLTEEQAEYLSLIQFSGENLLNLINDILDLTKLESGYFELHNEKTDLPELIQNSIKVLKSRADEKSVNIFLHLEESIPQFIVIDSRRLNQILTNLIGNAIKFTEVGSIHVYARFENAHLSFRVQDTGIGIPEDRISQLFQPFVQIHNHLTEISTGTGLGLSITKKIIEEMKGTIQVESVFGKGSDFQFTIPIETDRTGTDSLSTGRVTESSEKDLSLLSDQYRMRLLVVEDDPINRKVVLKFLAKLGYQADSATGGYEAIEMIKNGKYDLVFMDVLMPDLNGIRTTEEIRSLDLTNQPFIIALTANVLAEEKQACIEAGMNDFMNKPLLLNELHSMIKKWGAKIVQAR